MSPLQTPGIADYLLRRKLEAFGAVLIEGPKACGKTTTAAMQSGTRPLYGRP